MTDKELKEFNEKERAYFLGKTDIDPSTGLIRAEAQEAQAKAEAEFAKTEAEKAERLAKRREAFEKSQSKKTDAPKVETVKEEVKLPALPSKAELEKMEVKELIALGVARKVDVKANVDDKATIIEKLLKSA